MRSLSPKGRSQRPHRTGQCSTSSSSCSSGSSRRFLPSCPGWPPRLRPLAGALPLPTANPSAPPLPEACVVPNRKRTSHLVLPELTRILRLLVGAQIRFSCGEAVFVDEATEADGICGLRGG